MGFGFWICLSVKHPGLHWSCSVNWPLLGLVVGTSRRTSLGRVLWGHVVPSSLEGADTVTLFWIEDQKDRKSIPRFSSIIIVLLLVNFLSAQPVCNLSPLFLFLTIVVMKSRHDNVSPHLSLLCTNQYFHFATEHFLALGSLLWILSSYPTIFPEVCCPKLNKTSAEALPEPTGARGLLNWSWWCQKD